MFDALDLTYSISLMIPQPAFQAINLEPEENTDEQIDTTKELHVRTSAARMAHPDTLTRI